MSVEEFLELVLGLPEVTERESFAEMTGFRVRDKGFCYLSEAKQSIMVKATREEQAALVADDPETFSPSWTSGRFAWVEVKLPNVDPDHLAELVVEGWRLSAPKRLANTLQEISGGDR
ncbi:MmcQ/YjbR family DNA-binding protein [Actinomadura chibensis]|uniref:MmcQ/YjbR family DNA-binding protein n=1 Tax=Actinomadura chibensis TaxID=392828 RepID=A0A5D0NXY5_9ACTN|nr:MmcQ/YjbR family DNA-binding protein [Actinomadura chibensis]TYB49346.1 MmcQ/YjbR family DNA-binding protein [Actinomadura chibensis]